VNDDLEPTLLERITTETYAAMARLVPPGRTFVEEGHPYAARTCSFPDPPAGRRRPERRPRHAAEAWRPCRFLSGLRRRPSRSLENEPESLWGAGVRDGAGRAEAEAAFTVWIRSARVAPVVALLNRRGGTMDTGGLIFGMSGDPGMADP
jgi:hypothetical protein